MASGIITTNMTIFHPINTVPIYSHTYTRAHTHTFRPLVSMPNLILLSELLNCDSFRKLHLSVFYCAKRTPSSTTIDCCRCRWHAIIATSFLPHCHCMRHSLSSSSSSFFFVQLIGRYYGFGDSVVECTYISTITTDKDVVRNQQANTDKKAKKGKKSGRQFL